VAQQGSDDSPDQDTDRKTNPYTDGHPFGAAHGGPDRLAKLLSAKQRTDDCNAN